jgi:hypothetical protein
MSVTVSGLMLMIYVEKQSVGTGMFNTGDEITLLRSSSSCDGLMGAMTAGFGLEDCVR